MAEIGTLSDEFGTLKEEEVVLGMILFSFIHFRLFPHFGSVKKRTNGQTKGQTLL